MFIVHLSYWIIDNGRSGLPVSGLRGRTHAPP
jgi:hypothetical protein